ncbi:hypothetical protein ACTA6D_003860 [Escherichia coli]
MQKHQPLYKVRRLGGLYAVERNKRSITIVSVKVGSRKFYSVPNCSPLLPTLRDAVLYVLTGTFF